MMDTLFWTLGNIVIVLSHPAVLIMLVGIWLVQRNKKKKEQEK